MIGGGASVGRRRSAAAAVLTRLPGRTRVAVVTRCPVGCVGVRTDASGGVARAGHVTLIGGGARDGRRRSTAAAVLTGLTARAGVVVVASRPVGRVGVRTD